MRLIIKDLISDRMPDARKLMKNSQLSNFQGNDFKMSQIVPFRDSGVAQKGFKSPPAEYVAENRQLT